MDENMAKPAGGRREAIGMARGLTVAACGGGGSGSVAVPSTDGSPTRSFGPVGTMPRTSQSRYVPR